MELLLIVWRGRCRCHRANWVNPAFLQRCRETDTTRALTPRRKNERLLSCARGTSGVWWWAACAAHGKSGQVSELVGNMLAQSACDHTNNSHTRNTGRQERGAERTSCPPNWQPRRKPPGDKASRRTCSPIEVGRGTSPHTTARHARHRSRQPRTSTNSGLRSKPAEGDFA